VSGRDTSPIAPEQATPPDPSSCRWRRRLRRFFLRHLPLSVAGAFILLLLLAAGAYFAASTSAFENVVRKRLIAEIGNLTGGRVEIASFHWRLLHLEAQAEGVVIHGTEDPGEAPYAQVASVRAQVSILGILSPHIQLRDLNIIQPSLHIIVYPDGSTNQPHPHKPETSSKPAIETLFNLQAGHIAVENGTLDFDDRAAVFDYQNRYAPLDFEANDVSVVTRYARAEFGAPEFYRIEAGATNLNLSRNVPRKKTAAAQGAVQATLDLEQNRAFLRSLTLKASGSGIKDQGLAVSGVLEDFTHPRWQAKAAGDLDMRMLEPVTGYADAPDGIAQVDLTAAGLGGAFDIDGGVHVAQGSYIGAGITAAGITLDARVHADHKQLLITQIVALLRQGGEIQGSVDLEPWLPAATSVIARPPAIEAEGTPGARNVLIRAAPWNVPVNGKVTAAFKDVTLDTILDMVCAPPFRRLGLDSLVNGPAEATWSNGDPGSVAVTAALGLSPSAHTPAGEAPTSGAIDATYRQRTGAVELRELELRLPASELDARGTIGAYPLKSASAINVDFHSHNLGEFNTVLRSLGLERNGKTGIAALPIALAGQANFHGTWTDSLIKPHLTGSLRATDFALEMPTANGNSNQPQIVHMDSVEATGSYSLAQIAIQSARFVRGKSRIVLNGTLDASDGSDQNFDENSVLHAQIAGTNVDIADIEPFFGTGGGQRFPITGNLNTRIQVDGPLHAPSGSGSLEISGGSLYGEQVDHLQIEGAIANEELKVASATLRGAGGNITASGSYDFRSKSFQVDAHGSGIDVSQIRWLHQHNLDAAGQLKISVTGSGTLDDPNLQAEAEVNALTLGGQRFGALHISTHAANRALHYDASTQLEGAELALRGDTALNHEYQTQAQLAFTQFNIGALLKMENVAAFSGESALAGTVVISGPLAHPEQLHGDVQLRQLAMTIAGVPLQSDGGVHATLSGGSIHLDPLHVTGEDTDVRAQGTVSLQGSRQIDLAADGSINLKLAQTLDPDLTAAGVTTFKVEAHGPLEHPNLQGSIEFQNGSLSLEDLPNGLSQLHGTLEFNQNRLEVKSLTAMSGGGLLSVAGFLAYQRGIFANLSVTGDEVHIRYPEGVTSLANAKLQLQGSQNNLLLSGDVFITRFGMNPDVDLAALASQANSSLQTIAPPESASNHVRLDVHIASSPQLSFQNAFAKLAGDVDLRLRGTLASPSLLGRVSITEGSAMIAGTRYELERGDITFTNPVRIEPIIDLSATAHVEDYDISLGLNGPLQKLAITYRSDPPLPETDVVSLLALGHTASQQRLYTQQQEQSITNPTTDSLLGGALNATVSNRVQKLFGAGSVKIDPNYLGAFGNSTSRITVQEQLGRDVTLTYATDVNTTSQQLLQAEVAINRHVSLVVARDESGVFSMVIKATRRYR
jgi:translocation and assembly module TamB